MSALKFLPWILTAFIHSIPLSYLYYRFMTVWVEVGVVYDSVFYPYTDTAVNCKTSVIDVITSLTLLLQLLQSEGYYTCYEWSLRTDLTHWHWVAGSIIWTIILAPQVVVLVAVLRVHRFKKQKNIVQLDPSLPSIDE